MVAAAETALIERIPLQKDEGAENGRSQNDRTAVPPLPERAHAAPPLHGPHVSPTAALPSKK